METTLNKEAFTRLIDENIKWLKKQENTLENRHIQKILKWTIDKLYPTAKTVDDVKE